MESGNNNNCIYTCYYSEVINAFSSVAFGTTSYTKNTGDKQNIRPSITGGSGYYDITYHILKDGVSIPDSEVSKYINNDIFQTLQAGTYVITATVGDQKCPLPSANTSNSVTITVSDTAYWHVVGLKSHGKTVNGVNNRMVTAGDGKYTFTATLEEHGDVADGEDDGKFCIQNEAGTVFSPDTSGDFTIKESLLSKPISMKAGLGNWFLYNMSADESKYNRQCVITLDTVNYTLTIAPTDIVVYAKDGASRNGSDAATKYSYSIIADTTIYSVNGVAHATMKDTDKTLKEGTIATTTLNSSSFTSSIESARAAAGQKIIIKTTIDNSHDYLDTEGNQYFSDKYIVKYFNINGVAAEPTSVSSNVYTLEYTIPAKTTAPFLEITPIYYLKDSYKTSASVTTVTYYMEGFDSTIQSFWGDSIYAYPFYGTNDDVDNAFGSYPGQPFAYYNGQYAIEIPVDKNIKIAKADENKTVKGVTVNCGQTDYVHNILCGFSTDHQTYDSDGFYKIYNEVRKNGTEKPKYIVQTFKYKNSTNNRETYGGQVNATWGYTKNKPTLSYSFNESKTLIDNVAEGNGWEVYTDRYGRAIDIFGTVISNYDSYNEQTNPALRVISSGYIANIAGDYGSGWLVYRPKDADHASPDGATSYNGTYVANNGYVLECDVDNNKYAIPPSLFAIANSSSFTAYSANDVTTARTPQSFSYTDTIASYAAMHDDLRTYYAGRKVYISYESNRQIHNNTGAYRLDTKWEYSFASDEAEAEIILEFSDNGITYSESPTDETSAALCSAYFDSNRDDEITAAVGSTLNFTAVADTASATETCYNLFDGWYIKDGENYSQIDTNGSSKGSTILNGPVTLVARFTHLSSGSLIISHTTASNNSAFGSSAFDVVVYETSARTNKLYDSGDSYGTVTLDSTYISNAHSSYYVEVTLKATPIVNSSVSFLNTDFHYDAFNTAKDLEPEVNVSESTKTSVFAFTVGQLYNPSDSLVQDYTTLNYTSTFTVYPKYTFVYTDRDGTNVSYGPVTGTVPLTEDEKEAGHTEQDLSAKTTRTTDYADKLSDLDITAFKKVIEVTSVAPGADIYNTTVNCGFVDETGITLTYYYPGSGTETVSVGGVSCTIPTELASGTVPGSYGSKVNLSSIVPATFNEKNFYAWCKYDDNTVGEIITTERNFNYNVVKNQKVIAVYSDSTYSTDNWNTYIDDHSITLSKTGPSAGTFYNDSLVRFTNHKTNGSVKDLTDAEYGILIVYRLTEDQAYNPSLSITNIIGREDFLSKCIISMSDNTTGINSAQHVRVTKMQIQDEKLSTLNRADIVLKSSSSKFTGADYAVVAYLKESNGTVHYAKTTAGTY